MKPQKKKIIILKVLLLFSIFVLVAVIFTAKANTYSLELSISDGENIHLEYGVDNEMPKVTAVYKGSIFNRTGVPVEVETEGEVDFEKLGTYKVTYTAKYKQKTISATETVVVEDTIPPVIALKSDPEHFTSPNSAYEEEGFSAVDNYNGDITDKVVRQEKDGVVMYIVSDSSGNEAVATRTIVYKDMEPPVLTLLGEKSMYVPVGQNYTEPGYTAVDQVDGDLTAKVTVEGRVDTNTAGTYTLIYTAMDSEGNARAENRSIYVYQNQEEQITEEPKDKVVYLTFDDGPGKYTQQLLDVLNKYGVKVTFFVTNQHPEYQYLIGSAYEQGHTIAMHSYSHDYSKIYKSEQAYYEDLAKISDICLKETGVRPTIVRFPGGASNTISKKHCRGIMSALTKSMSAHGYFYCDWNVASGDADSAETADEVANNVIQGIQKRSVSVILQHDTKGFSVDAVEEIICWGLANGYTFLPLTENSTMVHHPVNN